LKVLFTTQSYFPFLHTGGPATKIRSIASQLASRGHEVTVLTADLGLNHNPNSLQTLELHPWGIRSFDMGVEVCYFRSLAQYRALTLNPDVIGFVRVNLQDFPIAHIYGLYDLFGPTAAFYCSRQKVPYVLEPMGMMRPIVRNIGLKRLYRFTLGSRLIRNARALIATSEQERNEFLELGVAPERIVVRRNGIGAPEETPQLGAFRAQWKIPPDAKVVLFLGRLSAKKSPNLLIQGFARWKMSAGRETNAALILAGPDDDASYTASLKEMVAELGMQKSIHFTGPIYGESRWNAYRDADVFVLPSQNENFGNAVAESVACGTPVIVTDQCGIASHVANRAGTVIPHDLNALERALTDFLSDSNLRERFNEGCRAMTRELSWNEPIREMESLYHRCLQEAWPA
jgi:glycosyltransferase involved in cell wall biosynthesis